VAWKGKVTAKSPDHARGEVVVNIEFFDDADPATILHGEQFRFPAFMSTDELVTAVRKVGSEERRKRAQVAALLDQIPIGYEVPI
jgi:hypothetical protein